MEREAIKLRAVARSLDKKAILFLGDDTPYEGMWVNCLNRCRKKRL
jgi:hypothetical protein